MSNINIVIYKEEWNSLSPEDRKHLLKMIATKYGLEIKVEGGS